MAHCLCTVSIPARYYIQITNKPQTLATHVKIPAPKAPRLSAANPAAKSTAKEQVQRREALAKLKEIEGRAMKASKAARAMSERLA